MVMIDSDSNIYFSEIIGKLLEQPSSAELFHYTNAKSLNSILGSGELHFTNILFMNDRNELKLFLNEVHKVLEQTDISQYTNPAIKTIKEEARKTFAAILNSSTPEQLYKYGKYCFVLSFSLNGKSASMQQRYGDHAFSLKMKAEGESKCTELIFQAKVNYSDTQRQDWAKKLVRAFIEHGEQHLSIIPSKDEIDKLTRHLMYQTLFLSGFCKDEAHEDEKEFRFLAIVLDKIQFKAQDSIVPYIAYTFTKLDLKIDEFLVGSERYDGAQFEAFKHYIETIKEGKPEILAATPQVRKVQTGLR